MPKKMMTTAELDEIKSLTYFDKYAIAKLLNHIEAQDELIVALHRKAQGESVSVEDGGVWEDRAVKAEAELNRLRTDNARLARERDEAVQLLHDAMDWASKKSHLGSRCFEQPDENPGHCVCGYAELKARHAAMGEEKVGK